MKICYPEAKTSINENLPKSKLAMERGESDPA